MTYLGSKFSVSPILILQFEHIHYTLPLSDIQQLIARGRKNVNWSTQRLSERMKRRDECCDDKMKRRDEAARSDEARIFEVDNARNDETTMKRSEDSIKR